MTDDQDLYEFVIVPRMTSSLRQVFIGPGSDAITILVELRRTEDGSDIHTTVTMPELPPEALNDTLRHVAETFAGMKVSEVAGD